MIVQGKRKQVWIFLLAVFWFDNKNLRHRKQYAFVHIQAVPLQ